MILDLTPAELLVGLVVCGLAVYRVTRLIVLDEVLGALPEVDPTTGEPYPYLVDEETGVEVRNGGTGLRALVDRVLYDDAGNARGPVRRYVGALLTCVYCVSVWVAPVVVVAWFAGPVAAQWAVVVAAVAGAGGFVAGRPGA